MPRMNMEFFLAQLTDEDKKKLGCCFKFAKSATAQDKIELIESVLDSVEHLLNDFVARRRPYKLGKTKDRIRKLKQEIKDLKIYPLFHHDLAINDDWIKYKEECLENIKPVTIPKTEKQDLIELLKKQTFDVYDRAHLDYLKNLNSNKEKKIKKKEICYFVNKAAFISILNIKLDSSFYGYSHSLSPVEWDIATWAQSILLNYKDTSAYKDARKHTLSGPSQANFL
jgi:hypothetical protein